MVGLRDIRHLIGWPSDISKAHYQLVYSHHRNIGNSLRTRKSRITPHQNLYAGQYNGFLPTTTACKMGRRLPDKVVHRIRIRLKAGEEAPAITKAVGVAKKTIYKLRLNLDIWGEPYAPATVVLGRPRALLPYQELVIYDVNGVRPSAYYSTSSKVSVPRSCQKWHLLPKCYVKVIWLILKLKKISKATYRYII